MVEFETGCYNKDIRTDYEVGICLVVDDFDWR